VSLHIARRHIAVAMVLGLVAGLFAARLLAEEWPGLFMALYEPAGAAVLALLTALLLVIAWLMTCRLTRTPPDVTPLLPLALLGVYVVQPTVNPVQAWTLLAGSLLLCSAFYVPRFTFHVSRFTFHVSRFTFHVSRFTFHVSRFALPGVILIAFLLYLRTLAPGVVVGDAAEFQTVLPTLGIAHPTGYPLYTLLGWVFTRLPLGEVAWRANLLSAICGALTVGVVYLIVEKTLAPPLFPLPSPKFGRGEGVVAALAALTFAATPTWWAQCVMAEIYTLGTLLVALTVYLVLRWSEGPRPPMADLWLAAGCIGLGLAHHRTVVLLVPAVLVYVWWTDWRIVRWPRVWLPALGLFLLPLALYAYFPLRWPALHGGQPMTWEQFEFLVFARGYAPALRLDGILTPDRWAIYLRLAVEQFGPAGLALAISGAGWLLARRPRAGVLTGLLYVATVAFGLAYFVPDVSVFFIPAHLVLALWIGYGLAGLMRVLTRTPRWRDPLQVLGLTVVALLPLTLIWANLPAVDRSGDTAAQEWGERALSYPIGPNAVIICDMHRLASLRYLAHGAGWRPDLEIVMPDTEAQAREIIAQALAAGRPVYLARFVTGLENIYALRSVGPLVEVSPSPLTTVPPIEHPADVTFNQSIRLVGFARQTSNVECQGSQHVLRFTFYWQTSAPIGQNLHPCLRLVDENGRVWAEESGRPPVDGLYPTTAWPVGSIVPDYHELTVPPGLPPGEYRVQVRLVSPFAREGLPASTGGDAVTLDTTTIAPLTGQPGHLARARFGPRLLMGYDQDETARPGGRVRLTLYWRALGPLTGDVQYTIRWTGETGSWEETVASAWSQGTPDRVWQETLTVSVPPFFTGPGQLWLGWREGTIRPGWLAPPTDRLPLASLNIAAGPDAGLANFNDQVLLLAAEATPTALSPGDELRVTLRWQCVRRMTTDYTVFVHLLDAGERIHGQADAQPIYGTRPTTTWREGEIIAGDVYVFTVKADAPPGTYRLEVGLYDAATMTRLHVLDADLRPVGDRVFLPPVITVR